MLTVVCFVKSYTKVRVVRRDRGPVRRAHTCASVASGAAPAEWGLPTAAHMRVCAHARTLDFALGSSTQLQLQKEGLGWGPMPPSGYFLY